MMFSQRFVSDSDIHANDTSTVINDDDMTTDDDNDDVGDTGYWPFDRPGVMFKGV